MTEEASTYNGLKTVYSINGVEKIGQICREIRLPAYITHKNELKMDQKLTY